MSLGVRQRCSAGNLKNTSDMTKEEKDLLLKDLCGRLLYGVIVDYSYNAFDVHNGTYVKHGSKCILKCYLLAIFMSPRQNEEGEYIKPYLRKLSSMTDEENEEYTKRNLFGTHWDFVDWCNKKGFDYRGLIEKGLAIELT